MILKVRPSAENLGTPKCDADSMHVRTPPSGRRGPRPTAPSGGSSSWHPRQQQADFSTSTPFFVYTGAWGQTFSTQALIKKYFLLHASRLRPAATGAQPAGRDNLHSRAMRSERLRYRGAAFAMRSLPRKGQRVGYKLRAPTNPAILYGPAAPPDSRHGPEACTSGHCPPDSPVPSPPSPAHLSSPASPCRSHGPRSR